MGTARHQWIENLRGHRWSHLFVANLRIVLGFAFVPSGLKKVLGQPFTEPQNVGAFHDFLHAFHATGVFYQFVGAVQLLSAVLLMTQTFATVGAFIALPVMTVIVVFCWSTGAVPTAMVATMMLAGLLLLLLWDLSRWRGLLRPDGVEATASAQVAAPIDRPLWRACGAAILVFYGLTCLWVGGIYRPKGVDLGQPAFYVLIMILFFPLVTGFVERRRRARRQGSRR